MSRLARLTALFQEGKVLTLTAPSGQEVQMWINKLSPFEQEQANHEGRVARARRMLAIREIGTAEYDLFQASAVSVSTPAIIEAIVTDKSSEHLLGVLREIRSDPAWREKVEVLEHTESAALSTEATDPEVLLMSRIMTQYAEEVDARLKVRATELRADLTAMDADEVRRQHAETYIEEQGRMAFSREMQRSQVYFCLRTCTATSVDGAIWDHRKCRHEEHWLESVGEVDALPDSILGPVLAAYQQVMVPPDVARFTDALPSSSDLSESSSSAGASTDSGPTETPDEPATTSS